MRIIFISTAQVPSDSANSIQVMKVCQAFTQLGHEVILLVPGRQPEGLKPIEFQKHYGLASLFGVEWLWTRNRRFFPWRAASHARRLSADLLYTWAVQSAALGRMRGMPVILEMHDLPSGRFGPGWFRLFLGKGEKKRLVPITRALQEALEAKYRRVKDMDVVIGPDGVDLERYLTLPEPEKARKELGLPERTTVLCTGHLYTGRGVELFLRLAEKFPQASFVWVGGKAAEVEKRRQEAQALDNVTFTGFVPNERIPLYQAAADVLLMPYQRSVATSSGGNTAAICSPMKMFEYMACGRAILTSDLPVLREVLDESMAVFCAPEDEQAWEAALSLLLQEGERRLELGRNARAVIGRYSWTERSRRILQGFENPQ